MTKSSEYLFCKRWYTRITMPDEMVIDGEHVKAMLSMYEGKYGQTGGVIFANYIFIKQYVGANISSRVFVSANHFRCFFYIDDKEIWYTDYRMVESEDMESYIKRAEWMINHSIKDLKERGELKE